MSINVRTLFFSFVIVSGLINYSFARAEKILPPSSGLPFGALNSELSADHLIVGPIIIGKDTVGSLFTKFARAPIAKGDAGSPALVCYTSERPDDQTTIIFEAWGRDTDSEIIGFTLLAEKNSKPIKSGRKSAKCLQSSLVWNALRTASGIGIGLDAATIKKILGQPLHETLGNMYYAYWSKVPIPLIEQATLPKQTGKAALRYDVLSVVNISMKNGRAVSINIRKTETY